MAYVWVVAPNFGPTVPAMKATGLMVKLADQVDSSTQTETAMKVCGVTARHVGRAYTYMQMEASTSESSMLITKTDRDVKNGLMAHFSKGSS